MTKLGKMNLALSLTACFAAIEADALVICIGIMILDSGLLAILEGVGIWMMAQPVILPISLLATPVGTLLRMLLAFLFEQPRTVAMTTGTVIGGVGSALFAYSTKDGSAVLVPILSFGSVAGLCGGWTWWRIEKPFLDRLNSSKLNYSIPSRPFRQSGGFA